jgi:bacillithiol system protein YtxJ
MNWNLLAEEAQLEAIRAESQEHPVMIFKHSTRCSISSMALSRMERNWKGEEAADTAPYLLDLIANRSLSSAVAAEFGVQHQSPQVLLISKGICVYDASHYDISFGDISEQVAVTK